MPSGLFVLSKQTKSEMTETMRLTEAEEAFDPLQDVEDKSYSQNEDLSASNIQKVDA